MVPKGSTAISSLASQLLFPCRKLSCPVPCRMAIDGCVGGAPQGDQAMVPRKSHGYGEVDHFGNSLTGLRAPLLPPNVTLAARQKPSLLLVHSPLASRHRRGIETPDGEVERDGGSVFRWTRGLFSVARVSREYSRGIGEVPHGAMTLSHSSKVARMPTPPLRRWRYRARRSTSRASEYDGSRRSKPLMCALIQPPGRCVLCLSPPAARDGTS
jgi:hypothetical protein